MVQQKLRNRLRDFEETFEIPLLMNGSTSEELERVSMICRNR